MSLGTIFGVAMSIKIHFFNRGRLARLTTFENLKNISSQKFSTVEGFQEKSEKYSRVQNSS